MDEANSPMALVEQNPKDGVALGPKSFLIIKLLSLYVPMSVHLILLCKNTKTSLSLQSDLFGIEASQQWN